jgi:hypothetical protein
MLLMLANKQLDSEKLLSGVELNYVKRVANVGGDLVGLGTFRRPTTLHPAIQLICEQLGEHSASERARTSPMGSQVELGWSGRRLPEVVWVGSGGLRLLC